MAASGGYYICAPATKIVAQPSTLTGSIGVVRPSAFLLHGRGFSRSMRARLTVASQCSLEPCCRGTLDAMLRDFALGRR